MSLVEDFREVAAKDGLGKERKFTPTYASGIDVVDYKNGKIDPETKNISIGFDGGKICMVVGRSGCGKSTFCIQNACNIVEGYDEGQVIHYDFERATTKERIKSLSGWNDQKIHDKYIHFDSEIFAENFYAGIKSLSNLKLKNRDELEIDSGKTDENGDPIKVLPPTVVVLDSLAVMTPKDIEEEEELSGSMSASQIAKKNTSVFKRITGHLKDANILLFVVNHITEKIEIGFNKTPSEINFLKQNEHLPGGKAPVYLSNYLVKLKSGSKLKEDKKFGLKGFFVKGEFIKSRSAAAGIEFTTVFDQANGFDNLLSNYQLLDDEGYISGSAWKSMDGYEDSFRMKEVKEKYREDEEFQKVFDDNVEKALEDLIPDTEFDFTEDEMSYNEELELYEDNDGNFYELDEDGYVEVEVEFEEEEEE